MKPKVLLSLLLMLALAGALHGQGKILRADPAMNPELLT
jgi:hypothetical protein